MISGGGAGHEPAHASYTGLGMLAASVSGDVFASPSAKQILDTIKFAAFISQTERNISSNSDRRNDAKDVLVIINNYTGDRLNFGLAIEKARVTYPHIQVESVVVADDVSLLRPASKASLVGPRGLAGNILVCKILGAFAASGRPLKTVKALGDVVVANLASIGVGLEHCHVPGRKRDAGIKQDALGEQECEIGLGLHNEPGVRRTELQSAEKIISEMLELILTSQDGDHSNGRNEGGEHMGFLGYGPGGSVDDVVLFVNNLGGISQLEMGAVLDETLIQLGKHPMPAVLHDY